MMVDYVVSFLTAVIPSRGTRYREGLNFCREETFRVTLLFITTCVVMFIMNSPLSTSTIAGPFYEPSQTS